MGTSPRVSFVKVRLLSLPVNSNSTGSPRRQEGGTSKFSEALLDERSRALHGLARHDPAIDLKQASAAATIPNSGC